MSSNRIISLLLSFLFISSLLIIPVSAADAEPPKEYKQVDGFFQWLARQGSGVTEWLGLTTWSTELYCAQSEDNRHYSTDYQFVEGIGDVETGYYYCICDYCGQTFRAYEQDVTQSYDKYVAGLDESLVSNDGAVYWKFLDQQAQESGFEKYSITTEHKTFIGDNCEAYYYRDNYHYYFKTRKSTSDNKFYEIFAKQYCYFSFHIETDGIYKLKFNNFLLPVATSSSSGSYTFLEINKSDGTLYFERVYSHRSYNISDEILFSAGDYTVKVYLNVTNNLVNREKNVFIDTIFGPYSVVPVDNLNNQTSNSNDRLGTIYGDYGITGDNGSILHSENNYIFDETNNTYNNPYNDSSKTVKNWSYDYSKRQYSLTFDDSSTATVTYGDENVTINENNTVYNVYYMGDAYAADHIHNYIEEVISEPTCTLAGESKYTCDICEKTYNKSVPALGHKWTLKQSVQTQYGENGELVQQGYVIYKCSTCGEEYKAESGAAPPGGVAGGGSGGDQSGGDGDQSGEGGGQSWLDKVGEFFGKTLGKLISLIGSVITGILDGLISLVDNVLSSLGGIVELFGNFGPAMGNLWSWLPPEIVAVMVAGVSIIVLVSVVKAFI